MGKVTGFLEFDRQEQKYQPASDRIRHFREFTLPLSDVDVERQAARCMDCGVPYCHTSCPVNNQIPDWNDLVFSKDWEEASRNLHSTNNFPEFTGRVCPAPCEEGCTLNLEDVPVTIKSVEQSIVDKAWSRGWIKPEIATRKTGKSVGIIGSGPAGLAAAQQLARAGHDVHVYEREPKAGGLLRYGIPDFKMEKRIIDRRLNQMIDEGVTFHYGVNVGVTITAEEIASKHDAVLIAIGSEHPRDAGVPGTDTAGVHNAMPFLTQSNRRVSGEDIHGEAIIDARGKHVVVIGGGDTASDCVGTSFRQGAVTVTQLDIRPMPPLKEDKLAIWPYWPTKYRTSSSQAEGAEREFAAATLEVVSDNGHVIGVKCARVDEKRRPIAGTEWIIKADLVFIAIGFARPVHEGLLAQFETAFDKRGNVLADEKSYATSVPKVFAAGDARRGQSLVVWAIREGRQAAHAIDTFLMGTSNLPR